MLTPGQLALLAGRQLEGRGQSPSFDKQFVRDWLETTSWDRTGPPPEVPVSGQRTRDKYWKLIKGGRHPLRDLSW